MNLYPVTEAAFGASSAADTLLYMLSYPIKAELMLKSFHQLQNLQAFSLLSCLFSHKNIKNYSYLVIFETSVKSS